MRLHRSIALLWLAVLAGCSSAEPTFPASGRVVYRNGQPFTAGGTIQFESTKAPYPRSMSDLAPDGTFVLTSLAEGSGSLAGEQRVCIIPHLTEPLLEGIARQRKIDPKYCAFHTSGITVNVERGTNTYVIEVDPPPGVVLKPK